MSLSVFVNNSFTQVYMCSVVCRRRSMEVTNETRWPAAVVVYVESYSLLIEAIFVLENLEFLGYFY